mgnify:CR=1 FL=1
MLVARSSSEVQIDAWNILPDSQNNRHISQVRISAPKQVATGGCNCLMDSSKISVNIPSTKTHKSWTPLR